MSGSSDEILVVKKSGTAADPVLSVGGAFVGDSNFTLSGFLDVRSLTIDLLDATRMNSTGVREWHLWMTGFREKNPRALIVLKHCPRFFIETMNMIYDFVPGPFVIESFAVPFFCESCDVSIEVLAERGKHYHETQGPVDEADVGVVSCDTCGAEAEVDWAGDGYFKCISKSKQSLAKASS